MEVPPPPPHEVMVMKLTVRYRAGLVQEDLLILESKRQSKLR